jgi:thiol-disulfide isomerase/thioredoxin
MLSGALGLAKPPRGDAWQVALPSVAPLDTTLLDGTPWRLADHQGQVVVLTFWATWCGPCKEELPALAKAWEPGMDWSILAVSLDAEGGGDKVGAFATKHKLDFPVAHDPEMGPRFGIEGIPAVRVLNGDGAEVWRGVGYGPDSLELLLAQVHRAKDADAKASLGRPHGVGTATLLDFGPMEADLTPEAGVQAPVGRHFVRSPGQWVRTSPAPVTDVVVGGGHTWVATEAELVALDAQGLPGLPRDPEDFLAYPSEVGHGAVEDRVLAVSAPVLQTEQVAVVLRAGQHRLLQG